MDTAGFENEMVADWLGLAGYLAEAIAASELSIVDAQAELRAELYGTAERRALERATQLARAQLGTDALITTLLDGVLCAIPEVAEVA
jgi:hypothetical protein